MKMKSVLTLLLVAAVATTRADEWSWGSEAKEEAVAPALSSDLTSDLFSDDLPVEAPLAPRSLGVDALPLEPHTAYTDGSVLGGEETLDPAELEALLAAEGSDREGRFLGLGDKLCSYGIGINCNKKYPAPVKSHYAKPLSSSYGVPIPKPPTPHYGAPLSKPPTPHYGAPLPKPPTPHYGAPLPRPPTPHYGIPHSKPHYPNRKHGHSAPTKGSSFPSSLKGIFSVLEPFMPGASKSKGQVIAPSYAAPNPTYAPLLPSYPPHKPVHVPSYSSPKLDYAAHKPAYVPPKPSYPAPKPAYSAPKQVYVNPVQTYTVTASVKPTVIEHHTHSHTHVYKEQDPYLSQGSYQVVQRKEISESNAQSKTHDNDHHDLHTQETIIQTPAVVQPELTSHNFQPGRIETGFQPMPQVSIPDTLFRPQRPLQSLYTEDCQCVPVAYCSTFDVIPRNNIRGLLDARTRGSETLSNATIAEDEDEDQNSVRRGRVLDLSAEEENEGVAQVEGEEKVEAEQEITATTTEEATETATESEITETVNEGESATNDTATEKAVTGERVRREAEEEEKVAVVNDRQGRQLTGFTPDMRTGCGAGYVCCRRPVFKAARTNPAAPTCGSRHAKGLLGRVKTSHIVEGDTEFGEYPWQAAILRRKDGDMMYVCGAALIDGKHVLTAAHCVEGLHPTELKIRLGEWDVSGQTEFYGHHEMRVAGVYLHPDFYSGNLNNDIAVIRLEALVDFQSNPHINPVCLPSETSDYTGQRCFATGWGKDAFGDSGKFSQILKEVDVPVVEGSVCQNQLRHSRLGPSFTLHQGNMCAGGEAGKDTCKGDGGGPLVCEGANGAELAGLVSWGIGCGSEHLPGVYVKVAHYLEWIRTLTRP